jgi:serine protein kinase
MRDNKNKEGECMHRGILFDIIAKDYNQSEHKKLHWEGSFKEYLQLVENNPKIARSAWQRIYDMILSYGTQEYTEYKKKIIHYNFFDDPIHDGRDAIYGLDVALMKLVKVFESGAQRLGSEKRVILLHGPVGSSKSTIVRLLKAGLEAYSRTDEGLLYTFEWGWPDGKELIPQLFGTSDSMGCPMNEEPLKLIPKPIRKTYLQKINSQLPLKEHIQVPGDLDPACRFIYRELEKYYRGDWEKIIEHVRIKRIVLSEKDRIGIGTFQPKDEKNQDSTELTGDINYRKIAIFGSDSDPRAFNFDGEFNIANRGLIEFVEVLKLDVAFLYDLLGASQEHTIKPKKFPQTDIDEVIIGHTNEPEFRKLQNNEFMEALKDRTIKIDIPYISKLHQEVKVYRKNLKDRSMNIHVAPHTLEMASMWAILTRLEPPKKANLTLLQKLKLYDGKTLPGFTEDNVKELRKEASREGLEGISPRYIQDKISNAFVSEHQEGCVNGFMVLNELESGLKHHTLITDAERRKEYKELLSIVKDEYADKTKNDVQRAISMDKQAIQTLCANYIDNIKAYTQNEKVRNKYTGTYEEPDERLMRTIEEKIDIPESRKDDFRREIMNYIGALAIEGKQFDFTSNERLQKALELKFFEDQKDSIKLTSLVSNVIDKSTQEKIDIVKKRLMNDYGYCDVCANMALNFVASIFARGDVKQSEDERRHH